MEKYSSDSKKAALVVSISVFASIALFSFFFETFSLEIRVWLVNIFTAITLGTIVYFILFLSNITSERSKIMISIGIAIIFMLFNPITLTPPETTIEEVVEEEIPKNVQEEVDTIYQNMPDNQP